MASLSGETVGVYPEAQKVAIQKMLGVYDPPFELIREETYTASNETHDITVDDNGQPFELVDAILLVETPQQEVDSSFGAGFVFFYKDSVVKAYSTYLSWTQSANAVAKGASVIIKKDGCVVMVTGRSAITSTNASSLQQSYAAGFPANFNNGIFTDNDSRSTKW